MFLKIEVKLFTGLPSYFSKQGYHATHCEFIGVETFVLLLTINPWRTEVFILMMRIPVLVLSLAEEEKCLFLLICDYYYNDFSGS